MGIFNLLNSADVAISTFGQTYDVYLNWIGKIIRFLISSVGTVGVGIILFSLVLKLIVMPFDVYQRIAMRKQNRLMKENQARMEKLQKQYGNDKEKYNQKLMEMYKENGINMFSSCLPMILSMVIFIVAINGFNAYSQYSNIENYNIMLEAYNEKIEYYCADLTEENLTIDGNVITVKDSDASSDKYIYYTVTLGENEQIGETMEEKLAYIENRIDKEYKIDVEKAYASEEIKALVEKAIADAEAEADESGLSSESKTEIAQNTIKAYFVAKAQDAVLVAYDNEVINHTKFIWIKNIWVTDATYKHPVLDYASFSAEVQRQKFEVDGAEVDLTGITNFTNAYKQETYELVTGGLSVHKTEANGWFILIALSIATILLQQWVTNRSQKEQQQFSTVDGQGAQQQKTTMIVMTAMFAIFSFMYSSAFSIYMITSNIFSLLSTIVINKAVDYFENKKDAQREQEKYNQRFPGRKQTNVTDKKDKK